MANSILQLAQEALVLYAPAGVNVDRYVIWIKQGWRRFVHRTGEIYTRDAEIPLVVNDWRYDLPDDYRVMKRDGVYLYYAPRTIQTAARVSNVVTVTTTAAHNLGVGVKVRIAGTTPAGATVFDGDFVVVTAATLTTFTYAQVAADDTATGGTVASTTATKITLTFAEDAEIISASRVLGVASRYSFPNAVEIAFDAVSNGDHPMAMLRYDAEEAADIDVTQNLPVPAYLDQALIGYGHYRAALSLDPPDEKKAALGLGDFEDGVVTWMSAAVERTQCKASDVLEE